MINKLFIVFSVPGVFIIVVLLVSASYKEWENPLIAAGTVGAAVSAIWAVIYLELIKPYFDRPRLIIKEPGFKPPFYRQAPEIETFLINNKLPVRYTEIGYYINILLKNIGKRPAKNCQALLTAMWKYNGEKWQKAENWISVPLRWAAGEEYEYVEGPIGKLREDKESDPISSILF